MSDDLDVRVLRAMARMCWMASTEECHPMTIPQFFAYVADTMEREARNLEDGEK